MAVLPLERRRRARPAGRVLRRGCTPSWTTSAPCSRPSACWRRGRLPGVGATTRSTERRWRSSAPRCRPPSRWSTASPSPPATGRAPCERRSAATGTTSSTSAKTASALLVGDVVGHGMEAAVAMGRLRTGFRMIAALHREPDAMVQAVSQQVEAIPNAMCSTVICAVLHVPSGSARLVPSRPPATDARAPGQGRAARRGGRPSSRSGARDHAPCSPPGAGARRRASSSTRTV